MNCQHCRRTIADDAVFCQYCGARQQALSTPTTPHHTTPHQPHPAGSSSAPSDPTSMWVAVGVGAFILMIIMMLARSGSGGSAPGQTARLSESTTTTESTGAARRAKDSADVLVLQTSPASLEVGELVRRERIVHGPQGFRVEHPQAHARYVAAALDSASALLTAQATLADVRIAQPLVDSAFLAPMSPAQARRARQLASRAAAREAAIQKEQAENAQRGELAAKWSYDESEDPMTSRKSRTATILSENTVSFGFPYEGDQNGELMLRTHPSYGRDVIVRIREGQILCPSYEDCTVRVRFDDGPSESFSGVGPADHSSTSVFIRNYSRFMQRMRSAKVVRIQIPVYQEGNPTFEFRVGGFDNSRYTGS